MTFSLIRQVLKQIRVLSHEEPNIAKKLVENVKLHLQIYEQQRHLKMHKSKKQPDDRLLSAFLAFMKVVNSSHSMKAQRYGIFDSFRSRIRLLEIYLGINFFVDRQCNLITGKTSIPIQILHKYPQFKELKTEKDKQFVESVIEKVFVHEQKYQQINLSEFFFDVSATSKIRPGKTAYELLSPQMRQYVSQTLRGQTEGVNPTFFKVYKDLFQPSQKTNFERVWESYLNSHYVLLDFDNIKLTQ